MKTTTIPASRFAFFRAFKAHPGSVGETYVEHMAFAGGFAATLFAAGFAALVHALVPPLFETTASRQIRALCQRMDSRAGPRR